MKPKLSELTALPPQDVIKTAATHFIAKGWAIGYQVEDTLILRHQSGPSIILGLFLLILMILPGILYLILAKGSESTMTIAVAAEEPGTRVNIDWAGGEKWNEAKRFLNSLPKQV